MNPPLEIHPSSLPRIALCQASAIRCVTPVNRSSPEARIGTAVHAVLANHVLRSQLSLDEAPISQTTEADELVAQRFGAEPTTVSYLSGMGRMIWTGIGQFYPHAKTEVSMSYQDEDYLLIGTADVLCYDPDKNEILVLDWKTGYADTDNSEQLCGYALLAMRHLVERGEINDHPTIYVATAYLRSCSTNATRYSAADIETWWADLKTRLQQPPSWSPGRHCTYCPHLHSCPARANVLALTQRLLLDPTTAVAASDQDLGKLWDQVSMLQEHAELWKDVVRSYVEQHGGAVDLPDGRRLVLETQKRQKVDFGKGFPVLKTLAELTRRQAALPEAPDVQLPPEALLSMCHINKTALEAAVRGNAPRRKKGLAWQQMLDLLQKHDTIRTEEIQILRLKSAHQTLLENSHE